MKIGQAPLPRCDHVGLLEAPGDANRDVPDLQRFSPRLLLPRSGFVQFPFTRFSPRNASSVAPEAPPDELAGNRLEALKGTRPGQHSIRVNDQYRVCFRWTVAGAEDVEIVDCH